MRVGAGIGLGDRERDLRRARGDGGEPLVALRLGAVAGDDRADDRGGDHDQEQRASGGRDLLADGLEGVHAEPASAVALGQVDAEVALLGERVPELGGRLVGLDDPPVVVRPAERLADAANGVADRDLLVGRDDGERDRFRW